MMSIDIKILFADFISEIDDTESELCDYEVSEKDKGTSSTDKGIDYEAWAPLGFSRRKGPSHPD